MELWIRSQDKTTLIKTYEIYISEQQNRYLIRAKKTSHVLGAYDTFDRALEILDEIQECLYDNLSLNGNYEQLDIQIKAKIVEGLLSRVYNMPKE